MVERKHLGQMSEKSRYLEEGYLRKRKPHHKGRSMPGVFKEQEEGQDGWSRVSEEANGWRGLSEQ